MTWEAVGVIVGSLTGFAVVVSGLAWLSWKRLARLDRRMEGDVRLPREDKQAMARRGDPYPWWLR